MLVLLASGMVYSAALRADDQRARIAQLERERKRLTEAVAALEAEIAYQEAPDRLAQLANQHLTLEPVDPYQVITFEQAPFILGVDTQDRRSEFDIRIDDPSFVGSTPFEEQG